MPDEELEDATSSSSLSSSDSAGRAASQIRHVNERRSRARIMISSEDEESPPRNVATSNRSPRRNGNDRTNGIVHAGVIHISDDSENEDNSMNTRPPVSLHASSQSSEIMEDCAEEFYGFE